MGLAGCPGQRDALIYIDDEAAEDDPLWCLAPTGSDDADYLPMDIAMAQQLIESHLCAWRLRRGWQVQVTIRTQVQQWRLVDCLSMADGGGDRLDDDYAIGDDEPSVLCESVVVVVPSTRSRTRQAQPACHLPALRDGSEELVGTPLF